MGDYYSGDGSSEEPKGKGKAKGTIGEGQGVVVEIDKSKLWRLYVSVKDRRLPDGGLVDGGLMV